MKTTLLSRTLLGSLIVLVGAGFLLDGLRLWDFSGFVTTWWPLLIVCLGGISLLANPRLWVWPSVIVIAGVLLQLRQANVVDFKVWSVVWSLAIVVTGLSLLFHHNQGKRTTSDKTSELFVVFSGTDDRNNSDNYTGGTLSAIFGGINLDLRGSNIKDKATLDVFTFFGGADLRVPEGWRVQTVGVPILGGWENKAAKPTSKNAPTLIVRGTCIFGGISVKN